MLSLPRYVVAPLLGALMLFDRWVHFSLLNQAIICPQPFSFSKFPEENIGSDLPAGLKRPSYFSKLPEEVIARICAFLPIKNEITARGFGSVLDAKAYLALPKTLGLNPLRMSQLSRLGYKWNNALSRNQFWQPFVGGLSEYGRPNGTGLKSAFYEKLKASSIAEKSLIKKLYESTDLWASMAVEFADSVSLHGKNEVVGMAALTVSADHFFQLRDHKDNDNLIYLYLQNADSKPSKSFVYSCINPIRDRKVALSVLRFTSQAMNWKNLTDDDKHTFDKAKLKMDSFGSPEVSSAKLWEIVSARLRLNKSFKDQWYSLVPTDAVMTYSSDKGIGQRSPDAMEEMWPALMKANRLAQNDT